MNEALSELKNTTRLATSSGVPNLPIGCLETKKSLNSLFSALPINGVLINPGPTALIRMPLFAYSAPAVCVSPTTPCYADA